MGAPAEPTIDEQAPLSVRTIRPAETGDQGLDGVQGCAGKGFLYSVVAWSGKEVSKSNNAPVGRSSSRPGTGPIPTSSAAVGNNPGTVGLPAEAAPRVVVAAAPPPPEK